MSEKLGIHQMLGLIRIQFSPTMMEVHKKEEKTVTKSFEEPKTFKDMKKLPVRIFLRRREKSSSYLLFHR